MKKIVALLLASLLGLAGCAVPEEPTAVQPPQPPAGENTPTKKATPIKLAAKRTPYRAHEFATGGPYSCVKATVTNDTQGNLEINPFYFSITGVDGEKRQAAVGVAKAEFETLTLAPGEKASGAVCAETNIAAKVLTFSTLGVDEGARAQVAQ